MTADERFLLLLNHLIVCAPDFPIEEKTSTDQEIDKALKSLEQVMQGVKQEHRRSLLDLARIEIINAREAFHRGDDDKGLSLLTSAEEHFKESFRPRPRGPSFIAGSAGILKVPEDGEES